MKNWYFLLLVFTHVPTMHEDMMIEIIDVCIAAGDFSQLIRTVGSTFNNSESLMRSFRLATTKEQERSREEDQDRDVDESRRSRSPSPSSLFQFLSPRKEQLDCSLDFDAVNRTFKRLFAIPDLPFQSALINALNCLSREIEMELKYKNPFETDPSYLNVFLITMEIPTLFEGDFLDSVAPLMCRAIGQLPTPAQAQLCRCWSRRHDAAAWLKDKLNGLQQLITLKVLTTEWASTYTPNDDEGLTSAVKVKIRVYQTKDLGPFPDFTRTKSRKK